MMVVTQDVWERPMPMNIYLYFDGECRDAFDFYLETFGGEFASLMTFADGPEDMPVPPDGRNRIMHVSLPLGGALLMGSDTFPGSDAPHVVGTNFAITVPAESREECDRLFARLAAGGTVLSAMEETFWGSYFGQLRDRFGVAWMFNFDLSGNPE